MTTDSINQYVREIQRLMALMDSNADVYGVLVTKDGSIALTNETEDMAHEMIELALGGSQ